MSDAQAEILVRAEMNDRLSAALQRINGQLSNTVRSLNGLKATSQSAVGATNAVGAAISKLSRNSNSLNGSLRSNTLNQQALSAAFRNSNIQANALSAQLGRLQSAGLNTTPIRAYITQLRVMDSMQKQIGNSMRAMQFAQMGTQLNAFSQRMTNAGTRITMGMTLPLVAFFRIGFQSFKALDKQVIRTSKLMADSFDDSVKNATGASKGFTDLGFALKELGDGLDKITAKWGVSRELVQGLAGDFAELGISAPDTLSRLTELTVEFEKLGNIDITQAQSTIQAMFQTISRIRTDKGLDVSSAASLKQMTAEIDGAIAFFNFAENKTTLSLNNIAEAFPEVTAAATSFGLNMQTTAAMLVPMIGAAFQTGASANSIKVSLQRMVATTKQNADMLKDLSGVLGSEFSPALDVSANGVMGLVNNYDLLLKKFGQKGALQFMSKLFGVRQGPRMEVAIAQMNKYQKSLKLVGTQEQLMAEGVERSVNAQLKLAGYGEKDMIKIKNLKDINDLTLEAQNMDKKTGEYTDKALRIQQGQKIAMQNLEKQSLSAGRQNLDAQGKIIVDNTKKLTKQNKIGEEFNKIQTESGKLLTGQLYGKSLTEKNKNDELERVRKSIEVQYGIARENVKSISRELVTVFGDVLQVLNPILKKISGFIRDLSPQTKKIIGVVLLALVAIGPLMRTIGAVAQLGAMFSNARAAGVRRFRGNVVELNDSLMRTSDIALRVGGNFKKFGQDGKIFTSRKDAKRLEKLAPIIAKQDRGETLTAKESAKGGKYIRQLAGGKAVREGKALLSQKNFYGLDQATKDYVRSLDPIVQTNKMVNDILTQQAQKTAGIARKAAQKILRIRPASNNTGPIYPTPTGAPIPASALAAPAAPAVTAPILSLRDILTQILASLQAIQACVCNAKAAATGRPSPAASGAPTNAPPAGLSGAVVTPVTLGQKPTATTGTSAPAGAAVTAVTVRPRTLPMVSPTVVNNNIPTPASLIPPPNIPAMQEKLPLWMSKGPSDKRDAAKAKLELAAKGTKGAIDIALGSSLKDAAQSVMVSIGKKPITPTTNPIPPAIETATVAAEETVATDVKEKAKRGRGRPKAAGPIPAAIDTAVVKAEETVAEAVAEGSKKRGRPKGSGNKRKAVVAPVTPATGFTGDYGTGYAKAIIEANQSVKTMVQGAFNSAEKASVDFKAVGVSIAKVLNLDSTKATVVLTKESLVQLFRVLGQEVPEKILRLKKLVDKDGNAIKVKIDTLAKIAGSIATGTAGKAMSPGARSGAGFTGTASVSKGVSNPLYAKPFNEDISRAVVNRQTRAFTTVMPGDIAVAKETAAQMKDFEADRSVISEQVKILADQARGIKTKIDDLVTQEAKAAKIGDLSLARVLQIKILSERRKMSDVQKAITDLKRTRNLINTELQSVRQSANLAFNNAQEQMASRGLTTFPGTKGKGMPFGSTTARARARRTGERYMSLVYGEKTSDGYRERRQVARPSYSTATESQEIKDRRAALAPKREAGLTLAREAITRQPDYIAREKKRVAQTKRDEEFARRQEADRLAREKERELRKQGIKPEKVEPVQASPVTRTLMPKDQFLAGQALNLEALNEKIKAANATARGAKANIKGLEGEIQELVNSKTRVKGGKQNAINKLNEELEAAKKKAETAKAAAKAAKDEIARINAYDPAKGGLPARTAAPDISAAVRPKSLSAGVQSGATTLGNINSQLSATLQIPTAVLDQFYQTLKIQGKGLAEVASNAGLQATDDLSLLKQELLKIGLTVEQALAKPAETLKQLQAVKFQDSGEVQALFQRLVMFARDVANKGVEKAFQDTIARFQNLKPTAAGVNPVVTKPASAPVNKAAYGFGLESAERKILADQIKSQIIAENKAAIDFMKFETKTLEYIGRAFEIEGRGKGKKEVVVNNLIAKLKEMGIAVEKAIVTEAIAPVTAATNAVTATAATGAGATADETAKVVEAEKNLTVAVEKTIADAAKAVTLSTVAAANPRLAAIASGVKLSPLASPTSGVVGPKATDATPAVAVRTPYSMPYVNEINSQSINTKAMADSIAENLKLASSGTAKQVQAMLAGIQALVRSVNGAQIAKDFALITGGNITDALKYLDRIIQEKLVKEAEKVKAVADTVRVAPVAPVAPAPPVAPKPPVATAPVYPTPPSKPMLMLNAAKESPRRAAAQAKAAAAAVGTVGATPIVTPRARVNLREIIAERLAIKAAMEAEKAAMAQRIRDNVALSQAIRERKAATDAANKSDRVRKLIDASVIPPRPSAGRNAIPVATGRSAGQVVRGAASAVFNPITTVRGIIKTGSLLGSALENVAKKVSPKRFGEQNVYKQRDYMGEARRVTFGRIADRNLQVTSRQSRIAEKDARVIAKETRATDRPNRNIAQLTQSRLPSQFRQAINPSIDTMKAIAKTYGPPIKSAMNVAKQKSIEGLKIAGQITRELTILPLRVPVVFTTGLIEAHKFAMKGVRAGIARLENISFFNTTYTGAAIITLAITLEKGLTKLGSAMTMGGQALLTSGQIATKFIQTAFTNPKAALQMASTGLTNSGAFIASAGKSLVSNAGAALKVAGVALEAGARAVGRGAVSVAKSAGTMAMAPVRGAKTMLVGGNTFVPQGTDAAGNAIATKKGGLFRRSVTQTTDATTGMMTEQRGKGMFGRMKGGVGRGVMGGIRGLGTAAGSMSSMMLYQLGPAGMALQGPLNKVITLLTRTKGAFFGVTLPIMLVVGGIFLLKKTFNAWKDQSTGVAENFGKAFKALGAVVTMLKAAFFDFFASLFGGAEDSNGATANIGKTVSKVAENVRKFAEGFKAFFERYILPAVYTFLSGISLIIKGVVSFVGNLIKFVVAIVSFFRGGGDKAKEAMGNAFKGMLKAIVNVLKGILKAVLPILNLIVLAVFKVVELIVQLFEWLVIGCVNLIRYMVTGIINLVFNIVKAYVFVIDKIIDGFVFLQNKAIDISAFMVKGIIKVVFGIIGAFVSVVKKVIEVFGLIPSGLGKIMEKAVGIISKGLGAVSWLARKVGLDGLADGIDKLTSAAKDYTSDIVNFGKETALSLVNGISSGIDWAENKALGLVDSVANIAKNLTSKLGGLGDSIGRLLQSAQNGLLTGVDKAADATNAFIGGFSDGIANLGKDITDWLSGLADGDDIKRGIGDSINKAVDEVAKDPSAATAAGKSIAEAIGNGIKSLKQNFYDKVVDNLGNSLGKLKDQVTKALEKQKDQSLKFFDDQIAAIDALAAADAELTAEKQKQEDERLRIAERALQRDSYLKNRALAIYEGRIDDARTMGLEEAKNQQEFNKETEKNAKDAQAAAKAKNVEAAKKVIENQKQVASNQFDKDLEDFQTFIENIGKNGTLTAAELTTQFNELKARADLTSSGMQSAFQGYYNALPTLIANNTAPTVGFFTSSMDTLIASAAAKYGLDTGTTDPATMLGVTNGMMSNLGTVYTAGFTNVVAPAYNDGQELLAGIAREFADPSASNPKSAAGIYAAAISNATAAVRAEFIKMKTDASSAFAEVVAAINDELRGLAITQAISDATEELKNTGGGTNPSGGSATSPATGVTGPTAPTGFGPTGLTEAGFLSKAGADKMFKLNDSSTYIKAAKAALAFYGFTGFDVNSERMGTGTVKAIKDFQTKYKVASGSGNLGPRTAEGLGLFSKVGVQKKFMGGMIKRAVGGVVPGFSTEGVPAILHGGEYVISSKAVQNLGLGLLTQLNGLKHGVPSFNVPKPQMPNSSGMNMNVTSHSQSETTQNYNFYVDNFIGEDRWFESMMKDYNVKVIPNNQKAAGLESRVVRTYNGINKGM